MQKAGTGTRDIREKALSFGKDLAALSVGASLFGVGFHAFLLPNGIVLGGATGIATVLSVLFGFRAGIVTAAVNLPLLALAWFVRGREGILRALCGILATSLAAEIFAFLPPLTDERLIAAVFGGGVMAAGLGIALLRGFTSGGSDLAAYLLRARVKHLSFGRLVLLIDGTIILLSAVALRSFTGLFYSVVAAVVFSAVLDAVISRSMRAHLALMICPEEDGDPLSRAITGRVGRGITVLTAAGWYTGQGKRVLLCAVRPKEADLLSETVRAVSPATFLVFLAAPRVFGHRFSDDAAAPPL